MLVRPGLRADSSSCSCIPVTEARLNLVTPAHAWPLYTQHKQSISKHKSSPCSFELLQVSC